MRSAAVALVALIALSAATARSSDKVEEAGNAVAGSHDAAGHATAVSEASAAGADGEMKMENGEGCHPVCLWKCDSPVCNMICAYAFRSSFEQWEDSCITRLRCTCPGHFLLSNRVLSTFNDVIAGDPVCEAPKCAHRCAPLEGAKCEIKCAKPRVSFFCRQGRTRVARSPSSDSALPCLHYQD